MRPNCAFIVMGVSGSGKSTVAEAIAKKHQHDGWKYYDADKFHSPENVKKMSSGVALTDEDRKDWLASMKSALAQWLNPDSPEPVVLLACSALKKIYRDVLVDGNPNIFVVYLKGSKELILSRLSGRHGHFMPSSLLDSQFATLEDPSENPLEADRTIVVDITGTPDELVNRADELIMQKVNTLHFTIAHRLEMTLC